MAGKIRLLMLWVGRDDVGSGVIRWRGAGDDKAIELLIGSDPKRAPGQLNKWGYLVEEMRGGESSVVGLISQENDDRLSDVKAELEDAQGAARVRHDSRVRRRQLKAWRASERSTRQVT